MTGKYKMTGNETVLPCSASNCPLFGDCLADYEKTARKPMANADRIRAMIDTNEKLAKAIMDCGVDEQINFCKKLPKCEACDYDQSIPDVDCMSCLIDWLQQPAEDNGRRDKQ